MYLHPRFDLSHQRLEIIHAWFLSWPYDAQSLVQVWLWNHVEVHLCRKLVDVPVLKDIDWQMASCMPGSALIDPFISRAKTVYT